ncbi:hypothetical protein SRHO_G00267940 [Serrasalmus rhombeus]
MLPGKTSLNTSPKRFNPAVYPGFSHSLTPLLMQLEPFKNFTSLLQSPRHHEQRRQKQRGADPRARL